MNNPQANRRDLNLENDVLRCCIMVQKIIEKELGAEEKKTETGEYGQTKMAEEIIAGQVIDTTASNTEPIVNDKGELARKTANGVIIKSAKDPKDIQGLKRLQEARNREILKAQKDNDEKEI